MNVLTAPKFLRRENEPAAPLLPPVQPAVSPEVAAFIDSTTRQREELAYLRAEVETLTRENRLANERISMLSAELSDVRAERDFFKRHDGDIMNSLGNIVTLITAAQAKARDNAYAPPGSGALDHAKQGDELAAGVADLAKKLAPEARTDA